MEILYFIPFIILFFIAISMVVQGWMVMYERFGYQENPNIKGHPEMKGVKKGDGLLMVKFTDQDFEELQKKVLQQKIDELFEEPSTYEDEEEET